MGTSEDVRDCRHSDEVDQRGSNFKVYSQMGCLHECLTKLAAAEAGCLPVFLPPPKGLEKTYNLCLGQNLEQFNMVQLNLSSEAMKRCDCPKDCEATQFGASINSVQLSSKDCLSDDVFLGVTRRINDKGARALAGFRSVRPHQISND